MSVRSETAVGILAFIKEGTILRDNVVNCTAKAQYQKFKQFFPEKKLHGYSPDSYVFLCAIYIFP
jgi:hypothetical protein